MCVLLSLTCRCVVVVLGLGGGVGALLLPVLAVSLLVTDRCPTPPEPWLVA